MMSNQNQSYRQTMEQLRAQQAWQAIEQVEGNKYRNEYGTLARGMAAMIQINGLAAAMAFLQAKAGSGRDQKLEYVRMYEHISARVIDYLQPGKRDLMDFIRSASTDEYRRATAEAIAYSIWLKRYVESKGWKSSESSS